MQATILYLCYISTEIFVPDLSYHRRRKYINQHQNTMNMKKFYLFLFIALAWTISASAQVPAFPGADGYGRYTTRGLGVEVYYVTSLEDTDTPGTLRYGVTHLSKVTILFKVSGTIQLNSSLNIRGSNITIAGQSAPGDGICLAGYPVSVSGSNVIVRYMRFRMGDWSLSADEADGADAFGGRFCNNVIIDHCSISWCTDECASFYANYNFTMQWCIISESLRMSLHSKGPHGYGAIWGGIGASYLHNLLIHHDSRTPRFGTGNLGTPSDHMTDMRNNVIYNWSGNGCYGAEGMTVNMINNYYTPGPATTTGSKNRFIGIDDATSSDGTTAICGKFYIDGNYNSKYPDVNTDNWDGVVVNTSSLIGGNATKADVKSNTEQGETPLLHQHTAQGCFLPVLNYAGCSHRRDAIDTRLTTECRNGTATYKGESANKGGIIDKLEDLMPEDAGSDWSPWPELKSETAPVDTDADAMPDECETQNGLDPKNPEDRNTRNEEGYTMLEVYLNSLVADITEAQYQDAEIVGKPGEPYAPVTTDVTVSWSMSSGKVGESATVSKEGIVTSSEYSLGSEINRKSTRLAYGKVITTFQPTIEYTSPEPTSALYFDFDLADGVTFRPTEISIMALSYGTSGGYFDLAWVDSNGEETILGTGMHGGSDKEDESLATTKIDLNDLVVPTSTGKCQLIVYVYKLSPTKELGLADIKIGGHLGYTAGINETEVETNNREKSIYNILGQPLSAPQKGFNIINGEKRIIR